MIRTLNSLRFILILMIVISHSTLPISQDLINYLGEFPVAIFFNYFLVCFLTFLCRFFPRDGHRQVMSTFFVTIFAIFGKKILWSRLYRSTVLYSKYCAVFLIHLSRWAARAFAARRHAGFLRNRSNKSAA